MLMELFALTVINSSVKCALRFVGVHTIDPQLTVTSRVNSERLQSLLRDLKFYNFLHCMERHQIV
jgi:hypothetical protein